MKNESTNRRKKLPLLLGALLIISVAAYGTRAYFSDSASLKGDIELSLGNVNITSTATNWTYIPVAGTNTNTEVNEDLTPKTSANGDITGASVTNVRPGDSFTRKYTITNNGSLEVNIKKLDNFTTVTNGGYQDGPFTITIDALANEVLLTPGNTKDINMTITVDPNKIDNDYNAEHVDFKNLGNTAKDYMENVITVEAVQTNVNPVETVVSK